MTEWTYKTFMNLWLSPAICTIYQDPQHYSFFSTETRGVHGGEGLCVRPNTIYGCRCCFCGAPPQIIQCVVNSGVWMWLLKHVTLLGSITPNLHTWDFLGGPPGETLLLHHNRITLLTTRVCLQSKHKLLSVPDFYVNLDYKSIYTKKTEITNRLRVTSC